MIPVSKEIVQRVLNYGKRGFFNEPDSEPQYGYDFKGADKELDAGCLLYVQNERKPMRFCAFGEREVFAVGMVKRSIPILFRYLDKIGLFKKVFLAVSLRMNYGFYREYFYHILTGSYRDVKYYQQAIREFYRVIPWEKESEIFCAILEYETAYRYRTQDIVPLINKESFRKNSLKEIKRLWEVLMDREGSKLEIIGDIRWKWKMIYKIIPFFYWYLRIFERKVWKQICQIVEDINLDEIKSSPEDFYWQCNPKQIHYNYGGLSYEKRQEYYQKEKSRPLGISDLIAT